MLLERGPTAEGQDKGGETPLSDEVGRGCVEIVAMLIQRQDVDINSEGGEARQSPLSRAAGGGHTDVVKLLLDCPRSVRLNNMDSDGRSAFAWAVESGSVSVLQLLDVNSVDSVCGNSAIPWAAQRGHHDVVGLLLGVDGLDVDVPDKFDRTPLSNAVSWGSEEVVRLLIANAGVQVDRADSKTGRTPLAWSANAGTEHGTQLLLESGRVVVDSKDWDGQTPLHEAGSRGFVIVVNPLLQHGADVNCTEKRGRTPLWSAAVTCQLDVVRILLGTEGIYVNRIDNEF